MRKENYLRFSVSKQNNVSEILWLFFFTSALLFIWRLFGWQPGTLFFSQDATQYLYPILHRIKTLDVSVSEYLYDPVVLGGIKGNATFIAPAFIQFMLKIGFPIGDTISLSGFLYQTLFGYLTLRAAETYWSSSDFKKIPEKLETELTSSDKTLIIVRRLCFFLIVAFAPFIAAKLQAGHINYPLWLYPASICLYSALLGKNTNIVNLSICLFAIWSAAQSITPFIFVYGALFLFPVAISLAIKIRTKDKTNFIFFGALIFSCILSALPYNWQAIQHFLSSDATRVNTGISLIYSYSVGNWQQWLSSIPWNFELLLPNQERNTYHETIHSFGPLLLFLMFFLYRPLRFVFITFFTSALIAIAFANHVSPISDAILSAIPFIHNLRVPTRVGLLLSVAVVFLATLSAHSLYAFAQANQKNNEIKNERSQKAALFAYLLFGSLLVALVAFAPVILREASSWLAVSTILYLLCYNNAKLQRKSRIALAHLGLIILAANSILAFYSHFKASANVSKTFKSAIDVNQKFSLLDSNIGNPLHRYNLQITDTKFFRNTGMVLGISSLSGYTQPLRRFSQLTHSLLGIEANPLAINWRIAWEEKTQALYYLYNSCCILGFSEENDPKIIPISKVAGQAWIPENFELFDTISEMTARMQSIPKEYLEALKKTAFLTADNASTDFLNKQKAKLKNCTKKIQRVSIEKPSFQLSILLTETVEDTNPSSKLAPMEKECLVVVATNFADNLIAKDSKSGQLLKTLPAYGSLLAVIVESNTNSILIKAVSAPYTKIIDILSWIAWISIIAMLILLHKEYIASVALSSFRR